MRRGFFYTGLLLLLGVVLVLSGCNYDLSKGRTTPTALGAAATPPSGVAPQTGVATPRPGETVVSAFTSVPQPTGPGTAPTEDLSFETPSATSPAETSVPAATPNPSTPSGGTAGTPIVHVVQAGETLSTIAARYGTTVQAIANANNIIDPNTIFVGQKLTIPVAGGGTQPASGGCRIRHTVQPGEWIWQIARNYGVSPYDLLAANGLSIQSGSEIVPGQVLCIP